MCDVHREADEFPQNRFEILIGTDNTADPVQQSDMAAVLSTIAVIRVSK